MMTEQEGRKRKKKQYYIKAAKKAKYQDRLNPGLKGFLITCNNNERAAVKESYNLLNEYADKLYGDEHEFKSVTRASEEEEDDVEEAMEKELDLIKDKVKTKKFRFQQVISGAKNVVFVKIDTHYDPVELIDTIMKEVERTGISKSRAICRITPVLCTCPAYTDAIIKSFIKLLQEHCKDETDMKYEVTFKIRNSNSVQRVELIRELQRAVSDLKCGHRLCHHDYDIVFNFEVIKGVCCISILRNYDKFRKYNIQEVALKLCSDGKATEIKDEASIISESNESVENNDLDKRGTNEEHVDCEPNLKVETETDEN